MKLKSYLLTLSPIRKRAEIDAKARRLIEEHGDQAYYFARDLARAGRSRGGSKDPTWTKVAVRIAALTNREIGLTGSDRRPGP